MKCMIAVAILAVVLPNAMGAPQYFLPADHYLRADMFSPRLISPYTNFAAYHEPAFLARTAPALVSSEPMTKSTVIAGPSGTITETEHAPMIKTILKEPEVAIVKKYWEPELAIAKKYWEPEVAIAKKYWEPEVAIAKKYWEAPLIKTVLKEPHVTFAEKLWEAPLFKSAIDERLEAPILKKTVVAGPSGSITETEHAKAFARSFYASPAYTFAEAPRFVAPVVKNVLAPKVAFVKAEKLEAPLIKSTIVAGPSGSITEKESFEAPLVKTIVDTPVVALAEERKWEIPVVKTEIVKEVESPITKSLIVAGPSGSITETEKAESLVKTVEIETEKLVAPVAPVEFTVPTVEVKTEKLEDPFTKKLIVAGPSGSITETEKFQAPLFKTIETPALAIAETEKLIAV